MTCHANQQRICEIIEGLRCDDTKLLKVYCKIESCTNKKLRVKPFDHQLTTDRKNRMLCAIIEFLESNESRIEQIHRQVQAPTVIERDLLTPQEHLNLLAQPKKYPTVAVKCPKLRRHQLSATRLKRLASPKLLRVLLTFDEHFHHLSIFQIENFLKLIYEKDYQTPSEFVNSLRFDKKAEEKSSPDDNAASTCRGLEGFAVRELDEECGDDEWRKIEQQCYSIIDFYPRTDQEQTKKASQPSSADELKLKQAEEEKKTKRDSEISFLRPSQINIAKADCERIFKKLEVFHALKMERRDKKKGQGSDSDDDEDGMKVGSKSKKLKKRKNRKGDADDDDDEKSGKKKKKQGGAGGKKGDEIEEEEEEDDEDEDEDEDDEEGGDICAKITDKEPEWHVEWRG